MSILSSIDDYIIHLIVKTLQEVKSECIKVIDVREQTVLFSYMIIATGVSSRQIRAMGQRVMQTLKENHYDNLGVEGLNFDFYLISQVKSVSLLRHFLNA